jgi:internalin A
MTNITNTKATINPDQLAILQELSQLLDTRLEEVGSRHTLHYYNHNSAYYYVSKNGNVVGLSIYYKSITSLGMDLICQLENLSHLHLNSAQIQDISPLSKLINLTSLSLYNNQINDISPLSVLKSIRKLVLSCNQIQDISPLSRFKNLIELLLDDNQIQDISSLSELKNLTSLSIKGNKLRYLNNLHKLNQVKYCDHPNRKKKKKYFKRIPLF